MAARQSPQGGEYGAKESSGRATLRGGEATTLAGRSTRQATHQGAKRVLRVLRVAIVLVLGSGVLLGLYIAMAPPVEPSQALPKLEFHEKSDIRRRPSLDSFPFARALEGTRLELLQTEGDWALVKVEGTITGWTQVAQGTIIPAPPPRMTRRQLAKQKLLALLSAVRRAF